MIRDGYFVRLNVGYPISTLLNILLLLTYLFRPLRINTSKYFIPITSIQNLIYLLGMNLLIPVRASNRLKSAGEIKCTFSENGYMGILLVLPSHWRAERVNCCQSVRNGGGFPSFPAFNSYLQ